MSELNNMANVSDVFNVSNVSANQYNQIHNIYGINNQQNNKCIKMCLFFKRLFIALFYYINAINIHILFIIYSFIVGIIYLLVFLISIIPIIIEYSINIESLDYLSGRSGYFLKNFEYSKRIGAFFDFIKKYE